MKLVAAPERAYIKELPARLGGQFSEQRALGFRPGALRIISGVKGSGKTTLLMSLAQDYKAAGLRVFHSINELDAERPDLPCALFLDDAHRLGASSLAVIFDLLETEQVELTVARRPWPRHQGVDELLSAFQARSEPVVVSPLSLQDLQYRLESRYGVPAPTRAAKRFWKQTCGLNWLVEHLLSAYEDGESQGPPLEVVPISVVHDVAAELSVLDTKMLTLVLAMGLGFDVREQVPAALADEDLDSLIANARSEGLITESEVVPPLLRKALLTGNRPALVKSLQRELVGVLTDRGQLSLEAARLFAADGFQDQRVADALRSAGDQKLIVDPALALKLYEEAEAAGLDARATAARRAEAAYCLGNLDQAARLVDGVLAQPDAPDLLSAVQVATAVWAARGMMGKSADVYKWLGIERAEPVAPAASIVLTGVGDVQMARTMLDLASTHAAPTLLAEASRLMGEGLHRSLTEQPHHVLALLIRASDVLTSSGRFAPMVETPAVLAALVAMHSGELEAAGSVIRSALAGGQGGPAHRPRLLLISAWIAMQQDDPDQAKAAIQGAQPPGTTLTPRDEFLRSAIEVGLARRAGDAALLIQSWRHAREALLHVSVDLYSLLPWGELMVAAARLRESAKIEPYIAEVWALLDKLGNPPLWSAPLHWSAVEAALLAERPSALAPHAAALVRASGHSQMASILAEAGKTWVSVLAGQFSVKSVEKAARKLASVGMRWEGSRLAGHAAPRAGDRKDMARLLACARDLDSPARRSDQGGPAVEFLVPSDTAATRPRNDRVFLSRRELEVARMVLDGKTYLEIGESLFISPRTVEHHMARIRRRLETTNRADTITQLRVLLESLESREKWANP